MAIGRKIIGRVEKSLFTPSGRYFKRKERLAPEKERTMQFKATVKKQKKDWKMLEDSQVLYKGAMGETKNMSPAERAKVLKKAEDIIFERVKKTYNDSAEKQSIAHQKLYKMAADLAMERMRLKK